MITGLCVLTFVATSPLTVSAGQHASSSKVEYLNHAQVAVAFAQGETLVQGSAGRAVYRVLTARRDHPGEVEFHKLDTDIMYIINGTATFVTGGTILDAKNTAPNEIRGKSIENGTPHQLGPGDIIIVPNGVPHWFKEVQPPFTYLVMKVR
jgi:glc operon protein GlcG